ncbi:hypothetical protein CAPTEDRAFT_221381 [Capitella teleta]|uniref:F5/8 type C domain-containing protein n=1 Tax=Capitella teleta TaxID=283909 RepID=R7UDD7_CAPTE|nr:hypothetical protein CAPTEDRAFT_221381 [Capitella teleta]|eukprot:ELU01282.1 hypothetical protein CAPTEDRAFT_221381 [Capitella teleta]
MSGNIATNIFMLFLSLRPEIIESSTSCQCVGYAPLICNVGDAQLSASSEYDAEYGARYSRWSEVGWSAGNDHSSWISVDLTENKRIGGVVTLASQYDEYVKSYIIQYRLEGSAAWVDYTDASETTVTFMGNENRRDPVLNKFQEQIYARYIRLLPLTYSVWPSLRWELLECTKNILPHSTQDINPATALCGSNSSSCVPIINNRIRLQWKGLKTLMNSANFVLLGKSLICSHYFISMGIEWTSIGCEVHYDLCRIQGAKEKGNCQVSEGESSGPAIQPATLDHWR